MTHFEETSMCALIITRLPSSEGIEPVGMTLLISNREPRSVTRPSCVGKLDERLFTWHEKVEVNAVSSPSSVGNAPVRTLFPTENSSPRFVK